MVTREDIRELAQFQATHPDSCALSFYFQPGTPQDKSHRSEAIQIKELIRNAMREVEKHGKQALYGMIWSGSWTLLPKSAAASTALRPCSPAAQ